MTAARSCACVVTGKVTDSLVVRPPTDVMAITSLPHAPANYPVSGLPLLLGVPVRQPLTSNRHHLPLKFRQQLRGRAGLRADERRDVDGAFVHAAEGFFATVRWQGRR
jgi:hypothetical protein